MAIGRAFYQELNRNDCIWCQGRSFPHGDEESLHIFHEINEMLEKQGRVLAHDTKRGVSKAIVGASEKNCVKHEYRFDVRLPGRRGDYWSQNDAYL